MPTAIAGVVTIEPRVFRDERGFFYESWHAKRYAEAGITAEFVQDNRSFSEPNILRGLHFQWSRKQAQLVWVVEGAIFDVCVDLRPSSSTFGRWVGIELTADRQIFMPPGIAHGFCVLGRAPAAVHYKCSALYDAHDEAGVVWNDPDLAIDWPIKAPIVSDRDRAFPRFAEVAARLKGGA